MDSQSSTRHPGRTSVQMSYGGPTGVGWTPPGTSVDLAAPQTREESVGRIGAPVVAVGHKKTAATGNRTFLFGTTVRLTEVVPNSQLYIASRTVPNQ